VIFNKLRLWKRWSVWDKSIYNSATNWSYRLWRRMSFDFVVIGNFTAWKGPVYNFTYALIALCPADSHNSCFYHLKNSNAQRMCKRILIGKYISFSCPYNVTVTLHCMPSGHNVCLQVCKNGVRLRVQQSFVHKCFILFRFSDVPFNSWTVNVGSLLQFVSSNHVRSAGQKKICLLIFLASRCRL